MTIDKLLNNKNLTKFRDIVYNNQGKDIPLIHQEYLRQSMIDLKEIIKRPGENVPISHAYAGHLLRLYRLDRMHDKQGNKLYDMHKYYSQLVRDIWPYMFIYYKKTKC